MSGIKFPQYVVELSERILNLQVGELPLLQKLLDESGIYIYIAPSEFEYATPKPLDPIITTTQPWPAGVPRPPAGFDP